ncbi:protein-tyrosine phosphatase-like protein [Trichoderma sp. SZMC 28015]
MEEDHQLQKVPNFRDVGKTVNQFLGERRVRENLFYRSGRLDDATAADKDLIRNELEIKTIVDLRTKTEILKQIRKHRRSGEASEIPGVQYHGIKINGRSFERHLLSLLSWWDFFKVIFFFIAGYRIDAVRVLSTQVMLPRGLVRLGLDTLDHCGSEIHQALSLYTSPQTLPCIIHCTQGKDRTGLICALVLMILGIPRAAIEHDYFLTDVELMPSRPQMLVEIHEIGLTDEWAGTAKDMISSIESHINDNYGGLDNYLDSIGFDQQQRTRIRETLLY